MKKFVIIVLICGILTAAGCASKGDAFTSVDKATREELVQLLLSAAQGGQGEYTLTVQDNVGSETVGEVSGSVSGSPAGAEVVSFSFLDNTLIEVGRVPVQDGHWGPVTVFYGPKALVLVDGDRVLGYWLAPQAFAMASLTAVSGHENFLVSPRESGLVALALTHSGKYQDAANLLAAMRLGYGENRGLPQGADVFGRAQTEGMDVGATAWAGYAAAVLADLTRSDDLWQEAQNYAQYLKDIDVPSDVEPRLAGWLLFSALTDKYPEFGNLPDKWQPVEGGEYDPLFGTWMLLSGRDIASYVDLDYQPESSVDKWIHYNLLASEKQLPDDLDLELVDAPGGKSAVVDGQISLEATSWMALAISGKFRDLP